MTMFRISFGGNGFRQRDTEENAALKARAKHARETLLDVGLDNIKGIDKDLVLFDYLADTLDARARARTPSFVVKIGPWVLGGSSGGAIVAFFQNLS